MILRADLHVHSCLSPCGGLDMSPIAIAETAKELGLDIVALTDHNCARNVPAFATACRRVGIAGIFGVELNTREEVHLLCVFAHPQQATSFGRAVEATLPSRRNDPETFGEQIVVDVDEVVAEMVDLPLFAAVPWSIDEAVHEVHTRGGLAVPAHVDRWSSSVASQLGFLPDTPFDAVERFHTPAQISLGDYPQVADSDAHTLGHLGRRYTEIDVAQGDGRSGAGWGFDTLRSALAHRRTQPVFVRSD